MLTSSTAVFNAYALELMHAGEYQQAYRWLREGLRQNKGDMHSLNNLASTLKQLGRETEAVPIYERLTAEHPDYMAPFNNLAFSYLRLSRYTEGWLMYRHRLIANKDRMNHLNPVSGRPFYSEGLPTLADLAGKDLIVAPEQGLGDELFFLRFLPRVLTVHGASRCWYAPSIKLYPLTRRLNLSATFTDLSFAVVPKGNAVAVPLGDLPMLAGHGGEWFPPSLQLEQNGVSGWRPQAGPIGVTWRAGNRELVHKGGISKFLPPEGLGWALRDDPRSVVVMQRNLHEKELEAFKKGLGHDRIEVFDSDKLPAGKELLAVCKQLADLNDYVGVSNTNMHLFAALGRTARVLVIHPAEWRWPVKDEKSSPWFPGFSLYRQNVFGWEKALTELHDDLALDHQRL